jgi:hypothetical protein
MKRSLPAAALTPIALAAAIAFPGCQSAGQSSDAAPPGTGLFDARQAATTGRYIPLSVGAGWTWKGFDTLSGLSGVTDSRVEALEALTGAKAGVSAYRIRSITLSGSTVNWQEDTGAAIVRHREQFFDSAGALKSDHVFTPRKLRLDEAPARTVLGASWTETYTDAVTAPAAQPSSTPTVTWTVEAVDETVTVPAGTFSCLRVHSVDSGPAGYDSTFWFARNVGKVKESGTEVRELVGYSIP